MAEPEPAPLPWWKTFLSEGTGNGSIRRAALFIAVLATLAICVIQAWRHGLDDKVKDLLIWLNSTLAVLAGHGKREERLQAADTALNPPAAPGGPP